MIKKNMDVTSCLLFFIIVCALAVTGDYLLTIQKGFHFGDEGFYLVGGMNPGDSKQQLTSFHYYLHLLMSLNSNIVFLRFFSLFLGFSSIVFLAFSFIRFFPENARNGSLIVMLIASMMTVYGFTFMDPTEPSYNSFTVVGSIAYYSIMTLALTAKNSRYLNFYSFMLGFIAVFVFFNKFTTGLSLIALLFSVYALVYLQNKGMMKIKGRALLLGILAQCFIYFVFLQGWHDFYITYKIGFETTRFMDSNHSLDLLVQYGKQIIELCIFSYEKYKFVFYSSLVVFVLRQIPAGEKLVTIRITLNYAILLLFFILSYFIDNDGGAVHFMSIASFYLSAILLMGLIYLSNLSLVDDVFFHNISIQTLFMMILLFFLPLLIACGTNNPIYMQIFNSLFVWIPISVFLAFLNTKIMGKLFLYLTVVGISILSANYVILDLHEMLYGFSDLFAQKYKTQVNDTELYLDQAMNYIIDNTRDQLKNCGFKANDYLIGLTDVPGLTYAVGARSPACPWYFGFYKGSDQFARLCMNLASEGPAPYFLLAHTDLQEVGFSEEQLAAYFKNFSSRYALCGEVKNIPDGGGIYREPYIDNIKLYKPIGGKTSSRT